MKIVIALFYMLAIACAGPAQLHKYVSDFVLGYRACFTTQIGIEFVKNNVNQLFTEYIDRYNSNRTATDIGRVFGTSDNSPYNKLHYRIHREKEIHVSKTDDRVDFLIFYDAKTESNMGKANIGGEFKLSLIVD